MKEENQTDRKKGPTGGEFGFSSQLNPATPTFSLAGEPEALASIPIQPSEDDGRFYKKSSRPGQDQTRPSPSSALRSDYYERAFEKMVRTKQRPVHPPSAYCLFSTQFRLELKIKKREVKLTQKQILAEIKRNWKLLDSKDSFQEQARKLYSEFLQLMEYWRENFQPPLEEEEEEEIINAREEGYDNLEMRSDLAPFDVEEDQSQSPETSRAAARAGKLCQREGVPNLPSSLKWQDENKASIVGQREDGAPAPNSKVWISQQFTPVTKPSQTSLVIKFGGPDDAAQQFQQPGKIFFKLAKPSKFSSSPPELKQEASTEPLKFPPPMTVPTKSRKHLPVYEVPQAERPSSCKAIRALPSPLDKKKKGLRAFINFLTSIVDGI